MITIFLIGIVLAAGYFLVLLFGERIILLFTVAGLLSITSSLGEGLRLSVQLSAFLLLGFLFFKRFGFNFKEYKVIPKELAYFFIVFMIAFILSSVFSNHFNAAIYAFFKLIIFFGLVYIYYALMEKDSHINYVIAGLFIAATVLTFSTLYELAKTGFDFVNFAAISYFRTGGLIKNVNAAGAYFAITIPLAISLYFMNTKKNNLFISVLLILLSVGFIISNSRSAILSLTISICLIFYFLRPRILKIFLISIISAFTIILIVPALNEFFFMLLRLGDGLSQRESLWQLTADMIKDNLIFGVGPGAYGLEMFKYFPVMLDSWLGANYINLYEVTEGANVAHNFYLAFFADMGILGLITSLLLPVVFLLIGKRSISYYKNVNQNYYILVIAIYSIGIGFFVRGLFDGVNLITYGYITLDLPFWLIFSVLIYYYLKIPKNYYEKHRAVEAY